MRLAQSVQVTLIVLGVLAIVIGGGLILNGYNQMQAAELWANQLHYCRTGPVGSVECPDNPYAGGGQKTISGLIVALIGGAMAYYGTR